VQDSEGNWKVIPPKKSPSRNTDKQNRESTPTRQEKTGTTTTKAARKQVQSPMDKDSPNHSSQKEASPKVATEEKPEKPNPTSPTQALKKQEKTPTPVSEGVVNPPPQF